MLQFLKIYMTSLFAHAFEYRNECMNVCFNLYEYSVITITMLQTNNCRRRLLKNYTNSYQRKLLRMRRSKKSQRKEKPRFVDKNTCMYSANNFVTELHFFCM